MDVSKSPGTRPFVATDGQRKRAELLGRFNLLFLYAPVAVGVLIVLSLITLSVIGAFAPESVSFGGKAFNSGLADILVILIFLPLALLGAVISVALFIVLVRWEWYRGQKPVAERDRLRLLLWRMGGILDDIAGRLETWAPRVARPIIVGSGYLSFTAVIARYLRQRILRR